MDVIHATGVLAALDTALNAVEGLVAGDTHIDKGFEVTLSAKSMGDGYYSMVATIHYPDGSYDTVSRGWNRDGAPF